MTSIVNQGCQNSRKYYPHSHSQILRIFENCPQKILRNILPSFSFSNFENFREYFDNPQKLSNLTFSRAVVTLRAHEHNALPISFLRAVEIGAQPIQFTFKQLVAESFQFFQQISSTTEFVHPHNLIPSYAPVSCELLKGQFSRII